MAVQQNKKSHARKCNRRSHDRVATPSVIYCESCGKPTLPHSVCPSCGTYRKHTVAPKAAKSGEEESSFSRPLCPFSPKPRPAASVQSEVRTGLPGGLFFFAHRPCRARVPAGTGESIRPPVRSGRTPEQDAKY